MTNHLALWLRLWSQSRLFVFKLFHPDYSSQSDTRGGRRSWLLLPAFSLCPSLPLPSPPCLVTILSQRWSLWLRSEPVSVNEAVAVENRVEDTGSGEEEERAPDVQVRTCLSVCRHLFFNKEKFLSGYLVIGTNSLSLPLHLLQPIPHQKNLALLSKNIFLTIAFRLSGLGDI